MFTPQVLRVVLN